MIIVGLDVGCHQTVAVRMSLEDFQEYPVSDAANFYDSCEFYYITTDIEGLEKLISLGDIFILEPTGNYSRLWHNNLLKAGKEVRLVPHNKTGVYRELCDWNYKDDEHDAIALAYYGWFNVKNPKAFNAVRKPDLHICYLKFLEKERINKELRTSINRARNLLHTEFPEAKNSKCMSKGIDTIWAFIAGKPLPKNTATRWKNRLSRSIGTAKKHGFSTEITRFANSIWLLQTERANIKQYFNDVLENPQYIWYKQAFDKVELGTYDRIIFLCQIHPFEQFIDSNGKELRIEKKRHKGKSGKPITRRIGLNKFHSKLGKAVYPWSSGEKVGHIVNGSSLARSHLYLWANRNVVMNARVGNPRVESLRRQYEKDTRDSMELITELAGQTEKDLESVKILLGNSRVGKVLLPLLEEALSKKKNPIRTLKSRGKQALGQWAKSRVGDRLVKILFKELIAAWRKHHL